MRQLAHALFVIGALLSATRLIAPYFLEISPRDYYVQSHWLFDFFIAGIALRLNSESNGMQPQTTRTIGFAFGLLAVAGYVLIATYSLTARGNSLLGTISSGIDECKILTLTLILMGSLFFSYKIEVIAMILSWRWLRTIAAISFSTYLVHIPAIEMSVEVFQIVGRIFEPSHGLCLMFMLITGIGISLACGLAFYALVERPVLILRKHLLCRM